MNLFELENIKTISDKINFHPEKSKRLKVNDMSDFVDDTSSSVGCLRNNPDNDVDEQTAEINLIDKLDYDCLAKIFMYLSVLERLDMERVCEKWKEGIQMSWYNVRRVDFNNLMLLLEKTEESSKHLLEKCGRYLTHLAIHDQYSWTYDLINNCENLIHFDINMAIQGRKISHENLIEIVSLMSKLKYLKVTTHSLGSGNLCNKIFDRLPDDMEKIHMIASNTDDSKLKPNYSKPEIASVPDKFNGLRHLTLQYFRLQHIAMDSLVLNKNTLVYLDLSKCHFRAGALSTFSKLNNLKHLILQNVTNLKSNITITTVAQNCPGLKHFEFVCINDMVSRIPYRIFCELKNLKNLEYLKLAEVDKSGSLLSVITSSCEKLKYLDIGEGCHLSTSDVQEITNFKNLQYLNLSWAKMNSQLLINIASNCLELKELHMSFKNISDDALEKLSNLTRLEKLDLHACDNLSDAVFTKIVSNCKNLMELNIGKCTKITEASLVIVGKLQYLEILKMDGIVKIPIAVFNDLFKLKNLSCSYCSSMTDESIKNVIDNCRELTYLDIRGTGITVKTLVHASKRQLVFKILYIAVDRSVENNYCNEKTVKSRYLDIN